MTLLMDEELDIKDKEAIQLVVEQLFIALPWCFTTRQDVLPRYEELVKRIIYWKVSGDWD